MQNSEAGDHGRMSTMERRETGRDEQLGGMHVPVRWRRLAVCCSLLGPHKCNIRNCRNHLPENSMLENVMPTKYGSHASSKHTGILDSTFLSNKTPEPSTVFQDAVFLGFLP